MSRFRRPIFKTSVKVDVKSSSVPKKDLFNILPFSLIKIK